MISVWLDWNDAFLKMQCMVNFAIEKRKRFSWSFQLWCLVKSSNLGNRFPKRCPQKVAFQCFGREVEEHMLNANLDVTFVTVTLLGCLLSVTILQIKQQTIDKVIKSEVVEDTFGCGNIVEDVPDIILIDESCSNVSLNYLSMYCFHNYGIVIVFWFSLSYIML